MPRVLLNGDEERKKRSAAECDADAGEEQGLGCAHIPPGVPAAANRGIVPDDAAEFGESRNPVAQSRFDADAPYPPEPGDGRGSIPDIPGLLAVGRGKRGIEGGSTAGEAGAAVDHQVVGEQEAEACGAGGDPGGTPVGVEGVFIAPTPPRLLVFAALPRAHDVDISADDDSATGRLVVDTEPDTEVKTTKRKFPFVVLALEEDVTPRVAAEDEEARAGPRGRSNIIRRGLGQIDLRRCVVRCRDGSGGGESKADQGPSQYSKTLEASHASILSCFCKRSALAD